MRQKRKELGMVSKGFGLSKWKDIVVINCDGETRLGL